MKKSVLIIRSIVGGLAILGASLLIFSKLSSQAETPKRDGTQSLKTVKVLAASPDIVPFKLPVYGKLTAYNRVELYAEVSGVLQNTNRAFLEGNTFKTGQTLLRIEDSEARAALMSQRSNYINTLTQVLPDLKLDYPSLYSDWEAYLLEMDVDKNTPAPPSVENSQAKIFLTSKGVFSAYHSLKSTEERLAKYNISAPFNGIVTSSLIRPGTLVRVGQPLGTFIDPRKFEIEVSVSIRFLDFISEGDEVALTSPDVSGNWTGKVSRINQGIDASSQTVKVYIEVKGENLREGMYLTGEISGIQIENAISIPRRLILDNNHIWTVQADSTLLKKEIEVVEFNEEEAIITGIESGVLYTSEVVPSGFTGMKVNYVQE